MTRNRQSKSDIYRSEQNIQNWSFDEEFQVSAVELLEYDGSNLVRKISNQIQQKIVESGSYTYICIAPVGTAEATAGWQICRYDTTGNKMFADADLNFDNVATDPTSLTYSYS